MKFGAKRSRDLARGGAESDPVLRAGDLIDGEPPGFEPGCQVADVVPAHAEAVAVLFRREPVVIVRRAGIALLLEQTGESRGLFRRLAQLELYSFNRGKRIERAAVIGRQSAGVNIPLQDDRRFAFDGTVNAIQCGESGAVAKENNALRHANRE